MREELATWFVQGTDDIVVDSAPDRICIAADTCSCSVDAYVRDFDTAGGAGRDWFVQHLAAKS